jgi:hypothetical protein
MDQHTASTKAYNDVEPVPSSFSHNLFLCDPSNAILSLLTATVTTYNNSNYFL